MDNYNQQFHKNIILASGIVLQKPLPDDYISWDMNELDEYLEENCYPVFNTMGGESIHQHIMDIARLNIGEFIDL